MPNSQSSSHATTVNIAAVKMGKGKGKGKKKEDSCLYTLSPKLQFASVQASLARMTKFNAPSWSALDAR